ncbi:protein of unknown function [Rhodovastum atsumiense]|nr:protein of unknown function [Rhodovastum atsumiense]
MVRARRRQPPRANALAALPAKTASIDVRETNKTFARRGEGTIKSGCPWPWKEHLADRIEGEPRKKGDRHASFFS